MGGISTNFCSFHELTADQCFNLHYPDAHKKVGWPSWSAQKNDTIGGWIVTTYPYPASEHDFTGIGETPTWENRHTSKDRCGYVIADLMDEEDAIIIAALLNRECYIPKAAFDNPERWRWVEAGYLEGSLRSL